MATWQLSNGQRLVNVHGAEDCAGRNCPLHNPSDHHMLLWPQYWRDDIALMERVCPHGIGHPDPDTTQVAHGCDGCCVPPPKPDLRVYFQCRSLNCAVEVFSAKRPVKNDGKFSALCPLCLNWSHADDPDAKPHADSDRGGDEHHRNGGCVVFRTSLGAESSDG